MTTERTPDQMRETVEDLLAHVRAEGAEIYYETVVDDRRQPGRLTVLERRYLIRLRGDAARRIAAPRSSPLLRGPIPDIR